MYDLCRIECGRKRSACAMDIIWSERKSNNIDIDIETLSFHIETCIKEKVYDMAIRQLDREYLPSTI